MTVTLHDRSRITLRSIRATDLRKREAERRQARRQPPRPSGGAARALRSALACRRSTAVLARGTTHPNGSARAKASRNTAPVSGGLPPPAPVRLQRAPRAPVVMPAGLIPEPPGCGVQIRPRAPHSLHVQVCLENTSLGSEIRQKCTPNRDRCQATTSSQKRQTSSYWTGQCPDRPDGRPATTQPAPCQFDRFASGNSMRTTKPLCDQS